MRNVIGITGGISSGKSMICNYLIDNNYKVIDCDKIAHDILLKGNLGYKSVLEVFGNDILNSDLEIDRKKLGSIVFSDKEKLKVLNSITHPIIFDICRKEISKYNGLLFFDVPLLFETNFTSLVDKVILVYVSRDTQINRLIKRDNISETDALKRINSQMALEDKVVLSDYVINNNLSKNESIKELNKIIDILGGK